MAASVGVIGAPLTRARVLAAAEQVILRDGPAKATVVDVARVLGVSHANVYKFFTDKAGLRLAVVTAWLERMDATLDKIASGRAAPEVRIKRWMDEFTGSRRKTWRDDPGRFIAIHAVSVDQPPAVWATYRQRLRASLARILTDGVEVGAFRVNDADTTAGALIDACVRFYHPAFYREWNGQQVEARYDGVWRLLLAGLRTGTD